jgi:hypothetical protein
MINWVGIKGFENYQINELGQVRSVDRIQHNKRLGLDYERTQNGKILSPIVKDNSYVVYMLSKRDKIFQRYAHRLIAETFLGGIPIGMVINHKDGNRINNTLENLEIVSQRDNALHSTRKLKKSSQYPGVYFSKGKFVAMGRVPKGGKKYLGRFVNEVDAYEAYKKFLSSENLQYLDAFVKGEKIQITIE